MIRTWIDRLFGTGELHKKPLKAELINILIDLARIYSPSGKELPVVEYADKLLRAHGFDVVVDEWSNLIAERGKVSPDDKFVCINAHTDTVQREHDAIIAKVVFYDRSIDVIHTNKRAMIGGDDKCGVAIALTLAAYTNLPMKIILTSGEEIGSVGAEALDPKVFDDVAFTFTLDRMNGDDLISEYCGLTLAPDTFIKKFIEMSKITGITFKESYGSYADTYILCKYAPAVNLSAGYYNPHSKDDFIQVDETYRVMLAVKNAIENKTDLMVAIALAPKDWQQDIYEGIGALGRYGDYKGFAYTSYGGVGSYGAYGAYGHYGSRQEKRRGIKRHNTMRKCQINFEKERGLDDKALVKRELPHFADGTMGIEAGEVDEYIDMYADGNIYDTEWDEMLNNGTLTPQEYHLGVDEKILRERYRSQGAPGVSADIDDYDEFEPYTQKIDLMGGFKPEDGYYGNKELAELGLFSGYHMGTNEDQIFIDYVTGQSTYQELAVHLNKQTIDRWLFDNALRARGDFVVMEMRENKGTYPEKRVATVKKKPHGVHSNEPSPRKKLNKLGFASGYAKGTVEDDIYVAYLSGEMTNEGLNEEVRDGLDIEVAKMVEDAKFEYDEFIAQKEEDDFIEAQAKMYSAQKRYDKTTGLTKLPLTADEHMKLLSKATKAYEFNKYKTPARQAQDKKEFDDWEQKQNLKQKDLKETEEFEEWDMEWDMEWEKEREIEKEQIRIKKEYEDASSCRGY
jgi:hypothetical protein